MAFKFSDKPTLEDLREKQNKFAADRNWDQYHSPRNLLLALVGEVGELAEIFQWKGEVKEGLPDFTDAEKEHVGQEMGDVLLYLIRLAEKCHIDLPSSVLKKIEQNGLKYPADKVYGKSHKYTEYQSNGDTTEQT
ncbi:dCTP pyrophosphatase 1-like [Ruditapes philippinarum]|uniref:dCTP pyrophosphatase 1-like n=1 Tax=Ruditapes philippinarum TaxID=129788 RepID=UPI00295ACD89|nr:dCTP pyrophosphatase 1-like [Ruditapes philippinarum]